MTSSISQDPTPTTATAPSPSALTTLISTMSISPTTDPVSSATLQTLHNLRHQHLWTSLQIHRLTLSNANHRSSPSSSADYDTPAAHNDESSTAFVVSGIPPHRIYTHPDEQLLMLERGLRDGDIDPERTFVIPTVQGQSWSLRRMAAIFDSLPRVDEDLALLAAPAGEAEAGDLQSGSKGVDDGGDEKEAKLRDYLEHRKKARRTGEWGGKRVLLGMVDRGMGGEGTVVYYVVQEGAVKPRQN